MRQDLLKRGWVVKEDLHKQCKSSRPFKKNSPPGILDEKKSLLKVTPEGTGWTFVFFRLTFGDEV